ncbi:MAG: class II aldolase/adducin family protein [Bacteroidales bacterium]|nr:class II aldolase/adducin family protein [Bacteroidales bacterium]
MNQEGVIKFSYTCLDRQYVIPKSTFSEINEIRNFLFHKTFIGQYPDGLSYGNISMRFKKTGQFYITASDTSKLPKTDILNYVKVLDCDIYKNSCLYKGNALPSSESLSHFVIYKHNDLAGAVVHLHNKELWEKLKGKIPTTEAHIEYGSMGMTQQIIFLLKKTKLKEIKIFAMGGHEDGLIAFGKNLTEAFSVIEYFEKQKI